MSCGAFHFMSRTEKLSRPSLMPYFFGAVPFCANALGASAAAAVTVETVFRKSLRVVSCVVMGGMIREMKRGFNPQEEAWANNETGWHRPYALWTAPAERRRRFRARDRVTTSEDHSACESGIALR